MKAENVLTAEYEFTDEPIDIDEKDGLREAVEQMQEQKDGSLYVEQDGVVDHKVYRNEKTGSVRIGAMVIGASYEVQE